MAKDPAFLFYTGDFTTGTQFFTDEQVGKYLRLLMAQHQHGRLSKNQMMFICKSYDSEIFSKFIIDSDGLYFNERLEIEVNKRRAFSESRSKNKLGKNKEVKIISKSYDNHMENENKDINISKHEIFKNECLQSQQWLETIAMNIKIPLDKIQFALAEFNSHLIMDGEIKQDLKDYKNHFTRWSRKVKEIKKA